LFAPSVWILLFFVLFSHPLTGRNPTLSRPLSRPQSDSLTSRPFRLSSLPSDLVSLFSFFSWLPAACTLYPIPVFPTSSKCSKFLVKSAPVKLGESRSNAAGEADGSARTAPGLPVPPWSQCTP